MPSARKIQLTMVEQGYTDDLLAQFEFVETKGNRPEPILALVQQMDKLLTREQCLAIMEKQGCCKGGQRDKDCKAFAKRHAEKSIAEKLALMFEVENMMRPKLNDDGTFTITMSGHQNGVHAGKTTCSCSAIKKLKQPFSVSSTYCGCCAGHFLHHYQTMLGVKLHLKEIVSSPLDTNGELPCAFTFEIAEEDR